MHTSSNRKFLASVAIGSLALILLGALYFFSTTEASKAELAYAEYSLLGKQAGAVIPASCDSNPPISHFGAPAPDCDQMCELSGNPDVRNNTTYSPATNSCVCDNGKTNPPNCDLPVVLTEVAFRTPGGASQLQTFIMSITADKAQTRLGTPVTLRWKAEGAGVSCTASGNWSGAKQAEDSQTVTVNRCSMADYSAKYNLSCTNAAGNTEDQAAYVKFTALTEQQYCSCLDMNGLAWDFQTCGAPD